MARRDWTNNMRPKDMTTVPGGNVFPLAFMPKRKRFTAVSCYRYASKEFPTRRAATDWLAAVAPPPSGG